MRNSLVAASAALTFGIILTASAVSAQEVTASTCRDLDVQVQSALQNSETANRDQAVREQNSGREFCSHGFYKNGAQHFAQALKLLTAKT